MTRWRCAIEQGDPTVGQSMQEELGAIQDWVASDALDAVVRERSGSKGLPERKQEAYKTLSLKLVEILDAISEDWATGSLIRHAVDYPMPDVRTAAADALGNRPMETYVPRLLARMKTPVEASFAITVYPGGSVGYQHSFYREGAEADYHEVRGKSTYLRREPLLAPRVRVPSGWETRARVATERNAARQSLGARVAALATAAQTQRRVEEANVATIERNRRIQYVLSRATGVDLGAKPADWWEWWRDRSYDYYELEKPYGDYAFEKPVYEKRSYYSRSVNVTVEPSSCFARGIKIWTLTGPVPIEEIKAGDRVLSQNPTSGELAYKPVVRTTTRNPSPLVKIRLGSETLTVTRGHMFWVSGQGLQMAKNLTVGAPLHGVHGAVTVDGLEDAPAAGPWYEQLQERPDAKPGDELSYNLIVDEFHTFFVGENRILSRDNFYGPVPGLPR